MAEHRKARKEQIQTSATALTYDMVRFLKGPLIAPEWLTQVTEPDWFERYGRRVGTCAANGVAFEARFAGATALHVPLALYVPDQGWSRVSSVSKAVNITKRSRRCERSRRLKSFARPMHYVRVSKVLMPRPSGAAACDMLAIQVSRKHICNTSSRQPLSTWSGSHPGRTEGP